MRGWFTPRPEKGNWHHVDNDLVRKLLWSGLLAATGALASIAAARTSAAIWRRVFDEEPPD